MEKGCQERNVRFLGEKYLQADSGSWPNRNFFVFPDDIWVLPFLTAMDGAIFSGSFADNLHTGRTSFSVKDIDVQADVHFLKKCLERDASRRFAEKFREDRSISPQIFNSEGLASESAKGVFVDELEYPRSLQMNFGRLFVEIFIQENEFPHQYVEYHGFRLKLISIDYRIKMLRSLMDLGPKNEWVRQKMEKIKTTIMELESGRP